MKKLKLITMFALASVVANATVRVVNNNGGGQYTDIESAVVASVANNSDTIYVCGSGTVYTPPTTRKNNLTFIGSGFNVTKQLPLKTIMSGSAFNVGDNNKIIGIDLANSLVACLANTVNIRVSRCRMTSSITGNPITNIVVDNCLFDYTIGLLLASTTVTNLVVSNCIFYSTSSVNNFFNQLVISGTAICDHNIFKTTGTQFIQGNPSNSGFLFSNNIFIGCVPNLLNASNIPLTYTYTNNYASNNLSAYGTGNIQSTTWPFVTAQGTVTGTPFAYAWDFHLVGGSTAIGAGTSGTDMGAYGGTSPYRTDGEPPIPQMDLMNLNGTQFTPGGTMNLQFQSTIGN